MSPSASVRSALFPNLTCHLSIPSAENMPARKVAKVESDETEDAEEADRRAAKEVESILAGNPVDIPGLDELVGTHESESAIQ